MKIRLAWEKVWEIEAAGTGLRLSLVRVFMGKRRVMRAAALRERGALPEALGKEARWTRAFLSLPRDQGIVRQLELPADIDRDLKSALSLQIETISAWPEPEVYWDYRAEAAKGNPKTLLVTVAVIPRAILDPWLKLFDSIGVPLSGATLQNVDANVIPARLRRRSARAMAIATYVLAACSIVVGLGLVLRGPYQQHAFAAEIQSEITRLEPEVKDLVRRAAELDTLTKHYEALAQHLKERDSNIEALKALATVLPQDTFVLNYRYQSQIVTILGVSSSALDVQSALEKSSAFKDVQFAAPITREASGKDRFALKMSIEANP
jgi:general secretion pathway protein L